MDSSLSRRRFLESSALLLGVSLVGCSQDQTASTTAPTPLPQVGANPDGTFTLKGVSQIPNGTAQAFTFADGSPGLYFKTQEGKSGAVSAKCTHSGCTVEWNASNDPKTALRCPCHESHFDLDGKVTKGPAKTALAHYSAQIQGEEVILKLT